MSTAFQKENVVLAVSRFDGNSYWIGNSQEYVAKGTALGSEFTETLYTPSAEGMTGKYDADEDAWTEIEDMSLATYYDIYGNKYYIGTPDGDYPDDAVTEEPPEFDSETQVIRFDEEWKIFDIKIGSSYYDSTGHEFIVSDLYFELPDAHTFDEPPEADNGYVIRLVDGEWSQIVDYRDQTVYSKADCTLSEVVTEIGDIDDSYTLLEPATIYDSWDDDTQEWVTDNVALNYAENQSTFKIEYEWAASQLSLADVQINKHLDGDEGAIATDSDWRTYRKALRAYCSSSSNVDGSVTYAVNDISDTYSVDDDGRPIIPSDTVESSTE